MIRFRRHVLEDYEGVWYQWPTLQVGRLCWYRYPGIRLLAPIHPE